jgi:hypothetical protein
VILLKRDFEVSTKSGVNSYDRAGHKHRWIFLRHKTTKMDDNNLTPNRNGEGTPDWHPSPSISVDPAIPGGLLPSRARFRFTGYHKIRNGRKECKRSSQRASSKEQCHFYPKNS